MKKIDRRTFIKSISAAGMGSLLAASCASIASASYGQSTNMKLVPTRPLGKTGIEVSMLGLGGSQDLMAKQILLKQALKIGVTYWDTAHTYSNSEEAMGMYFDKFPDDRKKVFLVTKANSSDPALMENYLETSLQRLKTDYVDMFFIHSVSNAEEELTKATKVWAEKEKKKSRIRFFGFSTHKNMERCLSTAASLGWIDAIMSSYNYRLMNLDEMKRAVDKCVKAGIGLVAMKTQAPFMTRIYANIGKENKTTQALTDQFTKKGFTVEQAKLKAVWANHQIASICSEMTNMTILNANVAAALDKTSLSALEKELFALHARKTASYYCKGCAEYCESEMNCEVPVSDVMRCVMYAHEYGEIDRARNILKQMSSEIVNRLKGTDFASAERICPNKMPIDMLMREAEKLLC
ncbi:MAG: aldo/keto reductase [Desulfobacterales bacterium]|nr:aldo/keto reductase [Desulfobacterales bacterium]